MSYVVSLHLCNCIFRIDWEENYTKKITFLVRFMPQSYNIVQKSCETTRFFIFARISGNIYIDLL